MNCNSVNQPSMPSPIINKVVASRTLINQITPLFPPRPTYGTFQYATQNNLHQR